MNHEPCEVTQLFPTLCYPMDCNLPGSSVHGIFQARVLEWVAISFSRGSSWPRDPARVSRVVGRCFTVSPWVGKIPWRRKWQPTPVLLPVKSHGRRSLVGYSPWGSKESETTEWPHVFSFTPALQVASLQLIHQGSLITNWLNNLILNSRRGCERWVYH